MWRILINNSSKYVIKMSRTDIIILVSDMLQCFMFCWPCIPVWSCKWNQLGAHFILSTFINLYMFRMSKCPSSGETTAFMRHLVLVILCGWLSGMEDAPCIPDSHPHRITSTKCRINAVVSPDYGHTVTRNK